MTSLENLINNIESNRKKFYWSSIHDGNGLVMMEEIAPGSADLHQIIMTAVSLSRATPEPHRTGVLFALLSTMQSRRNDIEKAWTDVIRRRSSAINEMAEYASITNLTWGAIKVNVAGAQQTMNSLIARGWELAEIANPKCPTSEFCFFLTTMVSSPQSLESRDYWAFKSFEPIANVGLKMANNAGILFEE